VVAQSTLRTFGTFRMNFYSVTATAFA